MQGYVEIHVYVPDSSAAKVVKRSLVRTSDVGITLRVVGVTSESCLAQDTIVRLCQTNPIVVPLHRRQVRYVYTVSHGIGLPPSLDNTVLVVAGCISKSTFKFL